MAEMKSVSLKPLSKEDFKNLAKKQQKAKRDEEAKTAKTRPQSYNAPMASSVSFDAPVKVPTKDADGDNRKLMDILGPYDKMSHVIMSGNPQEFIGVYRQPATPQPSKTSFFDKNLKPLKHSLKGSGFMQPGNTSMKRKDSSNASRISASSTNKNRTSSSDLKAHGTKERLSKPKESSNTETKPRSLSNSQSTGTSSSSASSTTENRSDHRSDKNVNNKDETSTSGKSAIVNSKFDPSHPMPSSTKVVPSQQATEKSVERNRKKTQLETSTVLQESKDENRNAQNGKLRSNPRLEIPEKNVEDMLKELTQMPKPLTAIQAPFKDGILPFQMKRKESDCTEEKGDSDSGKETSNEDDSSGSDNDDGDDDGDGPELKRETLEPMSSSESSSSSAESSESESDSDSVSGISCNEREDSPVRDKDKVTPTKLKASPDYMDTTTPSPSRQSWNLGAFLPPKPLSLEAGASDKSDPDQFDEVIGVKRSADQMSDENPQSVDQETAIKPVSADEFSPPAASLIDKQILSPLKSPHTTISPTKPTASSATYNKADNDNNCTKTKSETFTCHSDNAVVSKKSTSISSPDQGGEPVKQKLPCGQKGKQQDRSPQVVSDDSSSDSEIDVIVTSSPSKTYSRSVKNELQRPSEAWPNLSPPKKDSKCDNLLKGQDSVKLKKDGDILYSKQSDCDNSAKNMSCNSDDLEGDSMKKILNFYDFEPLSPIPSDPKYFSHKFGKMKNNEKFPVKKLFNGSVNYSNGSPSVLVQIDLDLLSKIKLKERTGLNMFSLKESEKLIDSGVLGNKSVKSSKLTSAKSSATEKSHKMHECNSELTTANVPCVSSSANNSQFNASDSSTVSANCETSSKNISENVSKPKVSHSNVMPDKSSDIPDWDLLPVKSGEKDSDEELASDCSSSCSDVEVVSPECDRVSTHSVSFNPSPPDKKKRKMDSCGEDNSKRQKTILSPSSSKIRYNQYSHDRASPKSQNDPVCEPGHDDGSRENSKRSSVRRKRNSSSSSQHSTLSQTSNHSSQNKHARRRSHSQRSQKKAKLDQSPDLSGHVQDSLFQSQIKPSPSALSTPLSSVSTKHVKSEDSESSVQLNGHIPQLSSIAGSRLNSEHRSTVLTHHQPSYQEEEEDKLLSSSEYQKKATNYKHKADAMATVPNSLEKYIMFFESVLYFLLSGIVRERDRQTTEASSLYNETHKLMVHHYHQFRLNIDSDTAGKSDAKFTVLCLRIQSLLYLKLYKLKRTENIKLKRILDDHYNKNAKSTSQPKPPSAPSPHQTTWNRSTGTPSPMSPTPSPANSVCSVGSVGSDQTPSKLTNGTSNSAPIAPPGSVLVPQRIHSITQKYFNTSNYLVQAHELWDQAETSLTGEVREFISQLDKECGKLTLHSHLLHLVKYCKKGLTYLKNK